jgi:DNA-binding transcriptional regulator YiaG
VTSPSLARVAEARRLANSGEARRIREAAKVSASELARSVAVAPSTLLAWEDGTQIPRADAADRWLAAIEDLKKVISAPDLVSQDPPPG